MGKQVHIRLISSEFVLTYKILMINEEEEEEEDQIIDIFKLTEIDAEADPWTYLDRESFSESYEATLYELRLGTSNSQKSVRTMLEIHKENIQNISIPLFEDIHELAYECSISMDSPAPNDLVDLWHTFYSALFARTKHKKNAYYFLDILPFVLTYSIEYVYIHLPTPLGLVPPPRVVLAKRIVYLLTSVMPLDSYLDEKMTKYFGPVNDLRPIARRPDLFPKTILLPVEDMTGLVDLERRPHDLVQKWSMNSVSPISHKKRPISKYDQRIEFLYPRNGERTFHEDLKKFSQKKRKPGDISVDLTTKSLLMRARCRDVEENLRRAQMEAAVKRTGLMHKFQQDRIMIEVKRSAVTQGTTEEQEIFVRQLRRNQLRGIFLEDPVITLDLLKKRTGPTNVPPLEPGEQGRVSRIVDSVLNQCAAEQRRREEVEFHCTDDFRNSVIDVRRVFVKSELKVPTP